MFTYPNAESIPVGVVVRRTPGVTRWVKWAWKALDILPGAGPADWKILRKDGEITEYHAATRPLTLYVSDTEAYVHELGSREPSVYIIMRPDLSKGDLPMDVVLITASPYEAQDYEDSGEEVVEKVAMPEDMRNWVVDFVRRHHREEAFIKRRRDTVRIDQLDTGIGDARIAQTTDVYRAPDKKVVLQ
jgi:hypothetical protein